MNIQIDGENQFSRRFDTTDEFVEYIYSDGPAELTGNANFALESLILAGVLFIVSQAIAAYYRKTAADSQKARHDQIMDRLERLEKNPNFPDLRDVLNDINVPVEVTLDIKEDALLENALKSVRSELPAVVVVSLPPPVDRGHSSSES